MNEIFLSSITISVVGVIIVFGTLFILVLFVVFMKWLDDKWENRELKEKENALMKQQTIDDTTLVLVSAAIATYFKGRAIIKRVRVLPSSRSGGSWANQARTVLQTTHVTKK